MKKLFMLALFFFAMHGSAIAGWKWQNPLPQGNILSSVWLASANNIYAVGYGNTILESSDGGDNWQIIDRVTPYNLKDIWGTGVSNIYAVGDEGTIIHSNGTTWEEVESITSEDLNAIWGSGENDIFVVGNEGTIIHYNGSSWSVMESGATTHFLALWGRGYNDVYAVGGDRKRSGTEMNGTGGIIYHYDGNEWTQINHGLSDVPNLNGVWGNNSGHLYMVGGDSSYNTVTRDFYGTGGIILHYNGVSWDLWQSHADWNLYSIWGDGNTLLTAGAYIKPRQGDNTLSYGKILRLNGDVWEEVIVERGEMNGLLSIKGFGEETLFAVGMHGVIVRYDGGSWHEISYGTRWNRLFMLGGTYPDHLYAVGGCWDECPGIILHYNSSTGKWEESYRKENSNQLGVWGAGPDDIYVVGYENLHYNGSAWEEFDVCSPGDHFWIWGLSPDDIYTWKPCYFNGMEWGPLCPDNLGYQFHGEVWGTSPTDIYAAGDGGVIIHHDGANCDVMDSGTSEILRGIWGSSSNDIYAVGGSGLTGFSGILHFDGQKWEEVKIPNIAQHLSDLAIIFGVWGTGPDNVFFAGDNHIDLRETPRPLKIRGVMLYYNGTRWEDIGGGRGQLNNFVWGVEDGSHVYTGGTPASILHYTPPIRGSIQSCVQDSISGIPLSDATLSLYAMGNAFWYTLESQLTESSGCIHIDELSPGRYYIVAEKEGYLPTRYPSYGSFVLQEGEDLNIGSVDLIEGIPPTTTSTTTTSILSTTTTAVTTTSTTTTIHGRNIRQLKELYNSGEIEGLAMPSSRMDFDGDGVHDIINTSAKVEGMEKYVISFQAIKGKTFIPFYDWVTPHGDSAYPSGGINDIDRNGTYEFVYTSISQGTLENQLLARIIVYDLLSGDALWESLPFYITSSDGMLPFSVFSGFAYDLAETEDVEWVIYQNEQDATSGEITGKVMIYQQNQNDVGFSKLLWEQTYPGFRVSATHDYDLDGDGKENLLVHLIPGQESTNKGAIIHYSSSGDTSFSELVRFEASQPGNSLHTANYTDGLFPTRVDHGIADNNLIFWESWEETDREKYVLYAYRADPPYTLIGTYAYTTADVRRYSSFYLDDYDGDGWNEITMQHTGDTSNTEVYRVEGGNFTLNKMWETGDASGHYYVHPHWDSNQDSTADLCLVWIPPYSDPTSFGTLTFHEWTGNGFSQIYQFKADYPGSRTVIAPLTDDDGMVTSPTGKLYVPGNLDCSPGKDLVIQSYHDEYSPQPFSEGKITIYSLLSQKASMESEMYNTSLRGSIVHLQSARSNDILMTAYQYRDGVATSNVLVLSCKQPCPLQMLYGEKSNKIVRARNFRDEILNKTPEGQELIRLYYHYKSVIVKEMREDESFRKEIKELIDGVFPMIEKTVN